MFNFIPFFSYILLGDDVMKKSLSYFGVFVLICFSFFYTDKAVDIVKRNDPIMKMILENSESLKVEPVNATINYDEIITGLNGREVNVEKSYQNMKKANRYLESMIVYDEVLPDVNTKYDKYIVKGNGSINQVSLVFKVDDIDNIGLINKILNDKGVLATFFIDGYLIEKNMDLVLKLINDGYEVENLGYNGIYSSDKFNWTNNMINSLTMKDTRYCYTEYKVSKILDLCGKYKMHTIMPTINATNYPFLTIKKNLESGSIISFSVNDKLVKELPSIISYITQKGYNIVTLSELISEEYSNEK